MNTPTVRLRSVSGHPFVFERMVERVDEGARPGDVVTVVDRAGVVVGCGLYNPRSQIVVRMLARGRATVDEAFWRERVAAAVALRRDLLRLDDVTDAYRLIHSEADGLSGLVVERYRDMLVFELFSLGMFQRVDMLAGLIEEALGPPNVGGGRASRGSRKDAARTAEQSRFVDEDGAGPLADARGSDMQAAVGGWRRVIRADERVEQLEGFRVAGGDSHRLIAGATPATATRAGAKGAGDTRASATLEIREHGVRFIVDPAAGHKTGFFCDQRDNRRRLAELSGGRSVLDLCCYTGGFGIYAKVRGRAEEVTAVDLDEAALAVARQNANLNQARIKQVHADAFVYLRQMIAAGKRFDVVVLDPPKLIATRRDVDEGRQRYLDLNKLAMQAVRPGGVLLTCSCSGLMSGEGFCDMLRQAGRIVDRGISLFDFTGAAGDHPVALECPETFYLKAAWLRVS